MADERGSIVSVTNSAGATLAINTYDGAEGVAKQQNGIPGATNLGRFQYSRGTRLSGGQGSPETQTWLPEAGLYHYKARMYSPTLGRFMQTDPIGYADSMNWYAYVGGDPVNFRDPLGQNSCNLSLASGVPGEMPCDWRNWTQEERQGYCDTWDAVGCELIDPLIEVGGRIFHVNNASWDPDTRRELNRFFNNYYCGGPESIGYADRETALRSGASRAEAERSSTPGDRNERSFIVVGRPDNFLGTAYFIDRYRTGTESQVPQSVGPGLAATYHSHMPDGGRRFSSDDLQNAAQFFDNNPTGLFALGSESGIVRVYDSGANLRGQGREIGRVCR